MLKSAKTLILISILFGLSAGCAGTSPSPGDEMPSKDAPLTLTRAMQGTEKSEVRFGRARLALGMDKPEVLEQIRLSRAQYDSLRSEHAGELFVDQPSDETIESDTWTLVCPTRHSHVLGGGSGIIVEVRFIDGRVVRIRQFPWLGG